MQEARCAPNGKITEDKLCEYFSLSASFMDDAFFYRLMTNMWGAPANALPQVCHLANEVLSVVLP